MRVYAWVAIFAGFLTLLYSSFHYGQISERSKQTTAILESQEEQAKAVTEIEKGRIVRELAVKEVVRYIQKTPDPSGCADADIPDDILRQLRPGKDKPKPDTALPKS